MKKKTALLLCTTLLLGTLSAGCASKDSGSKDTTDTSSASIGETANTSDQKPLTKVTLNEVAHSIFYAPQYVAIQKGYFEEEGLDLEVVTGFGADKVLTALISGEAQIGFMGGESSIYAYLEGANDVVVNFAQLTQRAGNFLVSREDEKDFQWSDLKGKTVLGGRKGDRPSTMVIQCPSILHPAPSAAFLPSP